MSSRSVTIQRLALNAVFSKTPIGLSRNFVSSKNSARTEEKGKGLLLCSVLHIGSDHWYIRQLQRDNTDVSSNIDVQ